MFSMRFDLRAPATGAPAVDLYEAALAMCEWADERPCASVVFCEHHASPDGYLPAPMLLASAAASRTRRVSIGVVALLAALHRPVELAEQMAVLDILSRGRVMYVLGLGYRPEEYDLYGIPMKERVARLEEAIGVMRDAWNGRPVHPDRPDLFVTPLPATPGGPLVLLGGGTEAAVRRAARLGLGMITERGGGLADHYRQACEELGTEPQLFVEGDGDGVSVAFVDRDPDAAWERIGEHLLHDATLYGRWNAAAGKVGVASVSTATSVGELKRAGHPYRVFTPEEAVDHVRAHGSLPLHPLCGGLPPELGWSTLRLLDEEVLPALGG